MGRTAKTGAGIRGLGAGVGDGRRGESWDIVRWEIGVKKVGEKLTLYMMGDAWETVTVGAGREYLLSTPHYRNKLIRCTFLLI